MDGVADDFFKVQDLARKFQVSVREVWRLVAGGHLPKPIKLGPKTTRWAKSEIAACIEKLKEERRLL